MAEKQCYECKEWMDERELYKTPILKDDGSLRGLPVDVLICGECRRVYVYDR